MYYGTKREPGSKRELGIKWEPGNKRELEAG